MRKLVLVVGLMVLAAWARTAVGAGAAAWAQAADAAAPMSPGAGGAAGAAGGGAKSPAEPPPPRRFVTEHHLQSGGTDISYTATAEEIYLHDGEGKPTASFFTISYVKKGESRPESRPVTFVYNGGPGSASIWLHFGMVGPRRIDIPSDATSPGAPPYRLKDNPWTILRVSDLVLVDPVGTGYSHALGTKQDKDFWGYDEDADSVAEFIRTYLTTHNRWNSPKFLLGESYGGIRSAMLVERLQQRLDISLNGVMLISPAINMGILAFSSGDITFATTLPPMAATAYYHKKLPDHWPSLRALLDEVEAFAGGEYLNALFKGDAISNEEKDRIAERLHRYTGLSKDYILRSKLRIFILHFTKELLHDEGKSVGLLDGRFTEEDLSAVSEFPVGDAASLKTSPIYVALFQDYLRNELKVDIDRRYYGINPQANESWKRPTPMNNAFAGYVDVTEPLAQGTKDNEALRVFCAAGYNDLIASYFATRYALRHSGIDPARMTIKEYEGGHMMYLHQPSLEALSNDLVAFISGH